MHMHYVNVKVSKPWPWVTRQHILDLCSWTFLGISSSYCFEHDGDFYREFQILEYLFYRANDPIVIGDIDRTDIGISPAQKIRVCISSQVF